MSNSVEERIKKAVENVEPWKRIPTSVKGVFLVKTPAKGTEEHVMVEINPIDEVGNPIKRRGIFLRKKYELNRFLEVMSNERLPEVMDVLENMRKSDIQEVSSVKI
jgi:hypothetical protein